MKKINSSNYGIFEIVTLVFSFFYTKIFFPKARLIRKGKRVRGKRAIVYKEGFTTGYFCRIETLGKTVEKKLIIGKNVIIGDFAHIAANKSVTIGNNVLLASRVFISDTSHGDYSVLHTHPDIPPNERVLTYKKVEIDDNVWIGENVSVLPGSRIGRGAIIGANSVVTGEIPAYTIAVGCPAKIIKKYNIKENIWEKIL